MSITKIFILGTESLTMLKRLSITSGHIIFFNFQSEVRGLLWKQLQGWDFNQNSSFYQAELQ